MEASPLLDGVKMPTQEQTQTQRISRLAIRDAGRYVVGVLLLLGVVFLWTASNFITANLETGEGSWNKPFLITYFNTASFTIYLLPTLWRHYRSDRRPTHITSTHTHFDDHHSHPHLLYHDDHPHHPTRRLSTTNDTLSVSRLSRRSTSLTRSISTIPPSPRLLIHSLDLERVHSALSHEPEPESERGENALDDLLEEQDGAVAIHRSRLSTRETAEIAALWSVVWFVANWAVNASLAWTSVASVTVLSSTSGFFTLALGRLCGVEEMTRTKVFAVIASFLGVLLVTRSDSSLSSTTTITDSPASHALFGDTLALVSAGCYAVYVILLKVRVGDEDRADMQLMLGFAGLFNTICLIPIFPLLHYLNWETFELPPTGEAWTICLINFCITLSSDYLYVLAMLKTTPMLVTIGLSLTIPLALLGSLFVPTSDPAGSAGITLPSLLGAGMVFVGFGILGWQGYLESKDARAQGVYVVGDREEEEEEGEGERLLDGRSA